MNCAPHIAANSPCRRGAQAEPGREDCAIGETVPAPPFHPETSLAIEPWVTDRVLQRAQRVVCRGGIRPGARLRGDRHHHERGIEAVDLGDPPAFNRQDSKRRRHPGPGSGIDGVAAEGNWPLAMVGRCRQRSLKPKSARNSAIATALLVPARQWGIVRRRPRRAGRPPSRGRPALCFPRARGRGRTPPRSSRPAARGAKKSSMLSESKLASRTRPTA